MSVKRDELSKKIKQTVKDQLLLVKLVEMLVTIDEMSPDRLKWFLDMARKYQDAATPEEPRMVLEVVDTLVQKLEKKMLS